MTAFIAAAAQYLGYRTARDLERRSKREEAMRSLRWAAELAVSDDTRKARLGVLELEALLKSEMLTGNELAFVWAALDETIAGPRQAIAQSAGETEVVVRRDPNVTRGLPVSSDEEDHGEEGEIR